MVTQEGGGSKDALCQRMGSLLLQHRVDELAKDVERAQKQRRWSPQIHEQSKWPSQSSHASSSSSPRIFSQADEDSDTLGRKAHSLLHPPRRGPVSSQNHQHRRSREPPSTQPRRLIVVDASLLIYSLRSVHDWLKAGDTTVVVPNEAIATLDVLKKGEHVLNLAARKATRFVDERADSKALMLQPAGARLRAMPARSGQASRAGAGSANTKVAEQSGADKQQAEKLMAVELEREAPVAVRETLLCALYYMSADGSVDIASMSGGHHGNALPCRLGVALPPPHMDHGLLEATALDHIDNDAGAKARASLPSAHSIRFAERADGRAMLAWAKRCGIDGDSLVVAPTAASWLAVAPTQAG